MAKSLTQKALLVVMGPDAVRDKMLGEVETISIRIRDVLQRS